MAEHATRSSNPFAPPTAEVREVRADGEMELASRWQRFWGAFIDGLISAGLIGLISWLTPLNLYRPQPGNLFGHTLVTALIGIALFALLQSYLLATSGQTIGKRVLGLRIVRPDGSRATLGRLLGLRYGVGFLVNIVPMLGPLYGIVDALFIFRESHRCLHDSIADTIVVRA